MDAKLQSSSLIGRIAAVPSKSIAHRALICSAVSDSETLLHMPVECADVDATWACLRQLGAGIERHGEYVNVSPICFPTVNPLLNCEESGATLRFLLPLASALCQNARFIGSGRLPERPIAELVCALKQNGVCFSAAHLPFETSGILRSGSFEIPGDVSSQYISALLMALPLLEDDSDIIVTSKLQSAPFVDMTLDILHSFGIEIAARSNSYRIPGGQQYHSPKHIELEGDWSNAAFFLAAGVLSGDVTVFGLDPFSLQGDRQLLDILNCFGAEISSEKNSVRATSSMMQGCEIDIAETPDLFPILSVLATAARGKTVISNISRLRYKESDRIESTAAMLHTLGAEIRIHDDAVEIFEGQLTGGTVDCRNDHRIAMSAAIAAAICSGQTILIGADCVAKSYPDFFDDFAALGGKIQLF